MATILESELNGGGDEKLGTSLCLGKGDFWAENHKFGWQRIRGNSPHFFWEAAKRLQLYQNLRTKNALKDTQRNS